MTDVFNINYSNIFGGEKATRPNRALKSAWKQEYLKLPANYQEIPEEEMYYEGGGGRLSITGITWGITAGLGLLSLLCPVAAPFLGLGTLGLGTIAKGILKVLGKKKLASVLSKTITLIAGVMGIGGYFMSNTSALQAATIFMGCTSGLVGAIGLAVDVADGSLDGWLSW